jgi:LmbE family N-acetylglucosaminyl deacetylase
MKTRTRLFIAATLSIVLAISAHLYWLSALNGDEVFPRDTFLDSISNKTALIIVAHDDDAIGCAGTITELVKKGWKVHYLTFYGNWRKEDNPIRKKEVLAVAQIQHLASTTLLDFSIQRTDTVMEPWMPIPYARFSDYMKVDSIKLIIGNAISQYKPSVLFTLDNIIGGYGHPEHVCVSQCAIDVCETFKTDSAFSVRRIYQAVFPRTLNDNTLKNNPAFIAAKKVYQAEGSPIPNVEYEILNSSKEKKQALVAYESQKRSLLKIWPYYYLYPHWLYFRIFDKEYFHTITVRNE